MIPEAAEPSSSSAPLRVGASLLLALVLVLTGCAEPPPMADWPSGLSSGTLTRFKAGGQTSVLFRPEGEVRGVVIYHHGAGERVDGFALDQSDESLVGQLLDAGWAVAASDAHGNHWGRQASIDANAALGEVLEEELDVDMVVLLAQSMGGLSSLTCIVQACVDDIAGWIGVFPLVDQRSMVNSSGAETFLRGIESVFDSQPPKSLIPIENVAALVDVPMLLWASPRDTLVPMAANATELTRRVTAAGGEIDLRQARGEHGHPSHHDIPAILEFLDGL